MDGKPAVGMQMPLSQANALIGQLDREYREAEYAPAQVTVRIDYMKDGQTDRYWLPLEVGAGGDLLEQMERRVESYRGDPDKVVRLFESVPETHREELREKARLRRLTNPGLSAADSAYARRKRKLIAEEAQANAG